MAEDTTVSNNSGNPGTDYTVWTDEITDPVNGGLVKKQYFGLADGTDEGTETAAVTAANGLDVDVTRLPAGTLVAAAQVGITGAAGTLVAANASRRGLTFRSLAANTQSVFFGPATVTLTTGMELKPGESAFFMPGEVPTNLIQAISTSGTQTIIVQEAT